MQSYLPLFVKSELILSVDSISTCTKYHLYFIVPPGVYQIKNNMYSDLVM